MIRKLLRMLNQRDDVVVYLGGSPEPALVVQSAYLCAGCDAIGDNSMQCERCGSTAVQSLDAALKRYAPLTDGSPRMLARKALDAYKSSHSNRARA